MSEPIQPIGKKSQPTSLPSSPTLAIDPLARLTQEFIDMNRLLGDLSQRMKDLESRSVPATKSEVDALLVEAKKGISINMNSQLVADKLAPALQAKSQEAVKAIEQAADTATGRITHSARYSAHAWSGRFGFTSGKAAMLILGSAVLLIVGLTWFLSQQYHKAANLEQTLTVTQQKLSEYNDFGIWMKKYHLKVWNAYVKPRQVKPQENQ
jgi:hypothetical protein